MVRRAEMRRGALLLMLVLIGCAEEVPPVERAIVFGSSRPPEHEGGEIYAIYPDGSGERRLTYSGEDRSSLIPEWSPDGSQIVFASDREADQGQNSIYVMDGDGSNVRRLTPVGSRDYFPHWSPDGQKIAFMSSRDGDEEIFVMARDGSDLQKLTDNNSFDAAYSWSPNGERLAFTSWRGGERRIYVMDADGSNVRMIGPGHGGMWTADGRGLWFMDYPASREAGEPCYGMMDLDGSVLRRWCGPEGNTGLKHMQCLSPDRSQVAFMALPDASLSYPATEEELERAEIFVANVDGSNLRRLTTNEHYDGHCSW
jgi:TolB protein